MPSKASLLLAKPEVPLSLSLSVSKVKTFKDCKAKFRFAYVEKLPRKEWDFHIFGKFLHEILENFHKILIIDPAKAIHVVMTDCFAASSENWKGKITDEQKKESMGILSTYLKMLNEEVQSGTAPVFMEAEKDFYIDIDGKILLNGYIDRIQIDPDGVLHVADYKTTQNKKYLKKDFFQLLTYAFVMCLKDPNLQKVRTSYILLRHNFEKIIKEFTREEIMAVESEFLAYADSITSEKLYRAKTSPLCNYCDYLESCEAGKSFVNKDDITKFGETSW